MSVTVRFIGDGQTTVTDINSNSVVLRRGNIATLADATWAGYNAQYQSLFEQIGGGGGAPTGPAGGSLFGSYPNPAVTMSAMDVDCLDKAYSNVNFATFGQASTNLRGSQRSTDNTSQNNEVVFLLPAQLLAGTWTFVLVHHQRTNNGIYTISVSPDASAWTDVTTVNGYAGVATNNVRTEITGLLIAAGMKYIRLKMATKDALSANFQGIWTALIGTRTGA